MAQLVQLKDYKAMGDERSTIQEAKRIDAIHDSNPEAFWEACKDKYGNEIKEFYDNKVKEQGSNI